MWRTLFVVLFAFFSVGWCMTGRYLCIVGGRSTFMGAVPYGMLMLLSCCLSNNNERRRSQYMQHYCYRLHRRELQSTDRTAVAVSLPSLIVNELLYMEVFRRRDSCQPYDRRPLLISSPPCQPPGLSLRPAVDPGGGQPPGLPRRTSPRTVTVSTLLLYLGSRVCQPFDRRLADTRRCQPPPLPEIGRVVSIVTWFDMSASRDHSQSVPASIVSLSRSYIRASG